MNIDGMLGRAEELLTNLVDIKTRQLCVAEINKMRWFCIIYFHIEFQGYSHHNS